MQAVILAAGKGERMGALTESTPKPLLQVAGKSLIEHRLDALPQEIDEVILVINYLGDQLRSIFGDSFGGRKVTYVEQKELNGSAGALWTCIEILRERFIVMAGDDLYDREGMKRLLKHSSAMGVIGAHKTRRGSSTASQIVVDEEGYLRDILPSVPGGEEQLIDAAIYVLHNDIFDYPMVPKASGSPEFGLPHSILGATRKGLKIKVVELERWFQITTPQDLSDAEGWLLTQ